MTALIEETAFAIRRSGRVAAVASVALALSPLLLPAAARADDAGAERAYKSNDRAAAVLERRLLIAYSTFDLTGRAGPLLEELKRARALIVRTRRSLIAQRASTPIGAAARAAAFRALSLAERGVLAGRAAVLARERGDLAAFRRLRGQADGLASQARQADRRARSLFAQSRAPASPPPAA
jgi:hypothetical protein